MGGRPAPFRASWSRCGGEDCLRLADVPGSPAVEVRPASAAAVPGAPPMAGRVAREGGDLCFVPRFPFVPGTAYLVRIAGAEAAVLVREPLGRAATTEVTAIRPTAAVIPRNLLRLYVEFSAPMSEGGAAARLRLVGEAGEPLRGALLPAAYELWDPARRRLTVLLDPARIKQGLAAHRDQGYPLREGSSVRVVVDAGWRDAAGCPLRAAGARTYQVSGDLRRRVDPERWVLGAPRRCTVEPLTLAFDRPLDHGLAADCLQVLDPDGRTVAGHVAIGAEERSWRLVPDAPWVRGTHRLVVDPVLEDVAGNSVIRVFDRDLSCPDDAPRPAQPFVRVFEPT